MSCPYLRWTENELVCDAINEKYESRWHGSTLWTCRHEWERNCAHFSAISGFVRFAITALLLARCPSKPSSPGACIAIVMINPGIPSAVIQPADWWKATAWVQTMAYPAA